MSTITTVAAFFIGTGFGEMVFGPTSAASKITVGAIFLLIGLIMGW